MASTGTSTVASPTAKAPASVPSGPSPDEMMVYWLDIALFGAIALFFLAAIPRTFGRISSLSKTAKGIILRAGSAYDLSAQRQSTLATTQYARDTAEKLQKPSSHAPYASNEFGRHGGHLVPTSSPPLHVPSLSSSLYPISSFFSRSLTPGKTYGKLALTIIYITGILVVVFYAGDPLAHPARLGLISVSQIPFVVVLGTKNNSIGMLLSIGYERLNYLHRLVGIVIFATSNLHAIGYFYKYAIAGTLSAKLQVHFIMWGVVALTGMELLYFLSIPFLRQRCYPLFLTSHLLGLFLFMLGAVMHYESAVKYVVIGIAIYGIDHVLRIVKSRFTKARVQAIPELGVTRIEVPTLTTGWRAGQHVRIRFLTTELGLTSWTIAHPFTIASASDSAEGKGLVLMCKKAGRWTNNLYAAAGRADHYSAEGGYGHYRRMNVIVEGPYGGLGNMVLSSYSGVLIVTGGSGVTLALSAAEEVVQMVQQGKSNVHFIEIVWITQDMNSMRPLASMFSSIISACSLAQDLIIKITVRYTRASAIPEEKLAYTLEPPVSMPVGVEIQPGRPNIKKSLDSVVMCTSSLKGPTGVAVCVCGPVELAAEVRETVRKVDGPTRSSVGGIELHEEVFGW